jgi:xanthine dehydrogenase accessory factor
MRELLAELTRSIEQGRPCAFCSVIETRGSTPQKAGAAMLVYGNGSQFGTLGGGCVEAEVKRRALQVIQETGGKSEVMSFCLDDDYGWDDGLICGGRMTMLVDPLLSPVFGSSTIAVSHYYRTYCGLVESGAGCTEIVALAKNSADVVAGSRYLFNSSSELVAQLADQTIPAEIAAGLKPLCVRPGPSAQRGFSYLPVLPRVTVLIVGGGHVGQAVAQLASTVDFDVWVLDDRDKFANSERFPTAQRHIVGEIGSSLQRLAGEIHAGVYGLIVTRGHNHDEEALYHLARSNAGYVGMIGSKRKIRLIFEDLIVKGIPEEALARVHAPLGLPIGSQTVPEIAVSIVAELIACRNTRRDGSLSVASGF